MIPYNFFPGSATRYAVQDKCEITYIIGLPLSTVIILKSYDRDLFAQDDN